MTSLHIWRMHAQRCLHITGCTSCVSTHVDQDYYTFESFRIFLHQNLDLLVPTHSSFFPIAIFFYPHFREVYFQLLSSLHKPATGVKILGTLKYVGRINYALYKHALCTLFWAWN